MINKNGKHHNLIWIFAKLFMLLGFGIIIGWAIADNSEKIIVYKEKECPVCQEIPDWQKECIIRGGILEPVPHTLWNSIITQYQCVFP